MRWRVEVSAAFLAALIDHARLAAQDTGKQDGLNAAGIKRREKLMVETMLDLAVKRAREIDKQGHA
jgi:hypothetical protein